jgi:hypothetical protein
MNFQRLQSLPAGSKLDLLLTTFLPAVEFKEQPTHTVVQQWLSQPTSTYSYNVFLLMHIPHEFWRKSHGFGYFKFSFTRVGTLCNGTIFWAYG